MRVNMEKLIVQVFERKRWIIEQVKQQMDLYDQHLASKCLLEGVAPPEWLWSPSLPSQTSELNKEEIISGLLFPHSRPSIICPSSHRVSYQQPVFLADNVKTLEVSSAINQTLDKQLLEEEWQYVSHSNLEEVGSAPNSAREQDTNVASPRDFQKERVLETATTCCEQTASSPFPEYYKDERDKKSAAAASCAQDLDFTTPGYAQGERVPNSISTIGCEQHPRITSPGYCRDEIAPDSCPDPTLSIARIQRSKSRQRALELRSSAKASKSRSNSKRDLQASPSENVGFEIPSLRSYGVNETEFFEHDENDQGRYRAEYVDNSNSQAIEGCQDIKSSKTVESRSPFQKAGSIRKSTGVDKYASVALSRSSNSPRETRPMNEIALLQPTNTGSEDFAKDEEKVSDPQSKICNELVFPDEVTRSKSLTPEFSSKSEHSNFCKSFSVENLSKSSNASPKPGHEVQLPKPTSRDNTSSMAKEVRMSTSQFEKVYSGRTTRSRSAAQGCRSKSELSGCVESSPVKQQSGHSTELLQSDDECNLLKPITVNAEDLLVEEDDIGDKECKENDESFDIGRLLRSRNLSQAGISRDEPVIVGEPVLLKNCDVPGDLVEHSTSDVSSRVKVVKPWSLCSKVESSPHHGRITRSRSSSRLQELAKECKVPSLSSEFNLISEQLEVGPADSQLTQLHELPVLEEPKLHYVDDKEEHNFHEMAMNRQEAPSKEEPPILVSSAKETDEKPMSEEVLGTLEEDDDLKNEPPEANIGLSVNDISISCQDASADSLKKRDGLFVSNTLSDVSAKLQAPGELSLLESLKEPPASSLSNVSADKESKASSEEDVGLLDVLDHEKSASTRSSQYKIIAGDIDPSVVEWTQSSHFYLCSVEPAKEKPSAALGNRLSDDSLLEKTVCPQHQVETSSGKSCSPNNRNLACVESGDFGVPERSIEAFCSSSPIIECSKQQIKRRRTLDRPSYKVSASSSPRGDVLDSDSVKEELGTAERSKECHNLDHYDVELQKMIGSASSTQLQLEEGHFFKEAVVESPSTFIFGAEQFGRERSQISLHRGVGSWNTDYMPCAIEASHLLASGGVHDSVGSPHVQPVGLTGSDDGSLPVLEGFVIQTDHEEQSGSGPLISFDNFQLPKTTVESSSILEQICRSSTNTPLLHLPATLNFDVMPDLNKSVPNGLLEGMYLSNSLSTKDDESRKLEGNSLFSNLGIENAVHGRSRSDCLPLSGAGSSADARNPCASPIGKLWYRSMPKSASSKKRGSSSPDLPCIDEENENVDEEAEKPLYGNSPQSAGSEKSGSLNPDLPCIDEEKENNDGADVKNASAERKPLAIVNENMKFRESVSEAKMPVDRQSLESVNTSFSFTATCNSIKTKPGKQNGGKRRCTGKGKENRGVSQGVNGARKNVDQLNNRFSKPKLSENSSLTTQGPRLSVKEPRHNNIVSNITSFIPLVQPKPPPAAITGKRDVKVKALEAAEAAKRLAEKKENERKMKKEALKLERAKQEQENLRKQGLEKKKKEEERNKKEAEMAERKRQREEEEKKLKEAKRKRVAEGHRQQREPEIKSKAEKGEKESKTRAMDVKTNAQKAFKDEPGNAEKAMRERANNRMHEAGSKTSAASKSSADDQKGSANPGKVSEEASFPTETIEESYDISPYKCSDDEDEDEDEDVPNTKFVPAWASKNCILLTISSQQNVDPEKIFPPKSFCSIGEVLMPRKLRLK